MEIMSIVLGYWWVWIITMIGSFAIVVYNQLKRMGRLIDEYEDGNVSMDISMDAGKKAIIKGLGVMIFFYITFSV